MKMSPYYKSFEDEGATWDVGSSEKTEAKANLSPGCHEDRLNKIRIVFDLWMDVQRRWVYLEGIFGSSADIQQLLPNEFARRQPSIIQLPTVLSSTKSRLQDHRLRVCWSDEEGGGQAQGPV